MPCSPNLVDVLNAPLGDGRAPVVTTAPVNSEATQNQLRIADMDLVNRPELGYYLASC